MKFLQLLKATGSEWVDDRVMRLSAALAYYSVFSLAPLLIIAISIAGGIFGEEAAHGAIAGQLSGALGQEAAVAVQEMIAGAKTSGNNRLMAAVGSVVLLISASGVFAQLKDAMNTVWGIQAAPGRGIVNFLRSRFLSLAMVLVIGFLLLISLLLSAGVTGATSWLESLFAIPAFVWQIFSLLITLLVVTLLFAMIFKILPDAEIEWRDVWTGAFLTALLFALGKFLLALYLGRQDAASTYGAAGALILILTWVYYSANILLFGAEFTQVYAKKRGRRIEPSQGAVRVGTTEGA